MNYSVYCHTFPDGKKYIGITSQDPVKRWNNGSGYKKQKIYNAILDCGWENIKHETLFTGLSKEQAEEQETILIKQFNTIKEGWNVATGGHIHKSYLCEDLLQMYTTLKRDTFLKDHLGFDAQREKDFVNSDFGLSKHMNFVYLNVLKRSYNLSDPIDCLWLRNDILNIINSVLDILEGGD